MTTWSRMLRRKPNTNLQSSVLVLVLSPHFFLYVFFYPSGPILNVLSFCFRHPLLFLLLAITT